MKTIYNWLQYYINHTYCIYVWAHPYFINNYDRRWRLNVLVILFQNSTSDLDNSSPASPPPYSEDIPTVEWSEGLSSAPPPSYTDVIQHREEYPSAIYTGNIPDGYTLSISPPLVINSSYNSSVDHYVNSSESTSHQLASSTITSLQQQPVLIVNIACTIVMYNMLYSYS
jgi:hypothetical protein